MGAPLQVSETGMANPLTGVTVSVYFAACPASIVALAGVAAMVKSANCTDSESMAVDVPEAAVLELLVVWLVAATVPVTEKLRSDDVTAARFPTVRVLDCPGEIEAGSKAQVAGATLVQPRTMEPVNALLDDAESVKRACEVPSRTVTELWLAVSVKEKALLPLRLAVWGLPAALSLTGSVPVAVPVCCGVKVTLIEQLAPPATLAPQLFVSPKLPVVAMLAMLSGAPPVLARVTTCGRLVVPTACVPKVRLAGNRLAAGGVAPVPVRVMVWGDPRPVSVRVTVPTLVPNAEGVKVTLMVQLAPAFTTLPQVFVWE